MDGSLLLVLNNHLLINQPCRMITLIYGSPSLCMVRDVQGDTGVTLQWSWLTSGSLMPGFVLAAQDQAITTNALRCNIFHLSVSLWSTLWKAR